MMSLGAVNAFSVSRRDAALVALLPRDAEVAELQAPLVAHEHVYGRQVAMQHLAAMQLVEHLQDAGDLAPRRLLREHPSPTAPDAR